MFNFPKIFIAEILEKFKIFVLFCINCNSALRHWIFVDICPQYDKYDLFEFNFQCLLALKSWNALISGCGTQSVQNGSPSSLPASTVGASVAVSCAQGFAFAGGASSRTFQCTATGWSPNPTVTGCTQPLASNKRFNMLKIVIKLSNSALFFPSI